MAQSSLARFIVALHTKNLDEVRIGRGLTSSGGSMNLNINRGGGRRSPGAV